MKNQSTKVAAAIATLINPLIYAKAALVFEDADNSSAKFQERLMAAGIADKKSAKPYAMQWASVKYSAKITAGTGARPMLPRNSDAERAMYRVLAAIYGSSNPFENGKGDKDQESISLPRGVVSKCRDVIIGAGLTKRQFNALVKQLREQITFA